MFGVIDKPNNGAILMALSEVCTKITDGTHQTPQYTDKDSGYIFLSSKDVTSGHIDWSGVKYIPEELHQELYKRLAPQRNDILLAKNGTTGIAALVDNDEVFDIYVSLALLRPTDEVDPTFLLSAINSDGVKQQFNAGLKGIGVPNLHLNVIRETKVLIPPFELQTRFADFVRQADKSKFALQQTIDELEATYKSLLRENLG